MMFFEQKGKDVVFYALVNTAMENRDIESLKNLAVSYMLYFLDKHKDEAKDQRERMRKFYKEHKDDTSMNFNKQAFQDPWVSENIFSDIISRECPQIAVNKKNIEFRMDTSMLEFAENHPMSADDKRVVEIMQDRDYYCAHDITLNIFVYRLGRYSYVAVHPITVLTMAND